MLPESLYVFKLLPFSVLVLYFNVNKNHPYIYLNIETILKFNLVRKYIFIILKCKNNEFDLRHVYVHMMNMGRT